MQGDLPKGTKVIINSLNQKGIVVSQVKNNKSVDELTLEEKNRYNINCQEVMNSVFNTSTAYKAGK